MRVRPVPFPDFALEPRLQGILFLLLDGLTLDQIAVECRYTPNTLRTLLSRLYAALADTLPPAQTKYHLIAQEFMRHQDMILRDAIAHDQRVADEDIDAQFTFFLPTPRAKTAAGA